VHSSRVGRQHQNPNVAQQRRVDDCRPTGTVKVTGTLPFALKREHSRVVYVYMNMETTNSMLVHAARFFSDRYAYRAQPDYLSELVAFGMIVLVAIWPIILLANAMAASVR
jgi:hypothetical protein